MTTWLSRTRHAGQLDFLPAIRLRGRICKSQGSGWWETQPQERAPAVTEAKVADWDTPPSETWTIWTHPSSVEICHVKLQVCPFTYGCMSRTWCKYLAVILVCCRMSCSAPLLYRVLEAEKAKENSFFFLFQGSAFWKWHFSLDSVPSRSKQNPGIWNNPLEYKQFDNYWVKQSSTVTFHVARPLKGRGWKLGNNDEF